jgi:hypothetical protein
MTLRTTYTYVELEVSAAAYDEIAGKLRAAGYDHAFHGGTIDMHGIGLTRAADPQQADKPCKHCGLLKDQHDDPSQFEPARE